MEINELKKHLNLYSEYIISMKAFYNSLKDLISEAEPLLSSVHQNHSDVLRIELEKEKDALITLLSLRLVHNNWILYCISLLPTELEKTVLVLKFINGYSWEQIAEILNYSTRHIYNIYNRSVKDLLLILNQQ